jgi:UDP-N-acetylglucosamine diphosphorylase/glucosamine-1-phosphate N-acetyltransferase
MPNAFFPYTGFTMRRTILFDDGKGLLAPLTDLRPAFDVRTGALTTIQRLAAILGGADRQAGDGPQAFEIAALFVPKPLADLTRQSHPQPVNQLPDGDGPFLLINGRCPLPADQLAGLGVGQGLVEAETGDLVAALVGDVAGVRDAGWSADGLETIELPGRHLLARPWHVRDSRDRAIEIDLDILARRIALNAPTAPSPPGVMAFGDHGITVAASAKVYPGAVLDAELGRIVIDERAIVRPGTIIRGPAYIGPDSILIDHALIKPNTAIGPACRVAGEIGGTIFQGYANKSHDGHLGDSWVGQWVNLGAGTTNSNLLNTYGRVWARATPDGPREDTGQTHLGAIIGDHVKTAICTRIMTGAVIHTGVMWAASEPISGCIEPFTWATDAGRGLYQLDKFIETARTVMARRGGELDDTTIDRIRALRTDH